MTETPKSPSAEVEQLRGQLDELRSTDPATRMEDAKQRVGATVSNAAASVTEAASNAAASVTEAVAEPLRQGAERVRGVVDSARRTADQVSAQKESLSQRIQDKPLASLGIAVLAGYVFGRIVR